MQLLVDEDEHVVVAAEMEELSAVVDERGVELDGEASSCGCCPDFRTAVLYMRAVVDRKKLLGGIVADRGTPETLLSNANAPFASCVSLSG